MSVLWEAKPLSVCVLLPRLYLSSLAYLLGSVRALPVHSCTMTCVNGALWFCLALCGEYISCGPHPQSQRPVMQVKLECWALSGMYSRSGEHTTAKAQSTKGNVLCTQATGLMVDLGTCAHQLLNCPWLTLSPSLTVFLHVTSVRLPPEDPYPCAPQRSFEYLGLIRCMPHV